jgi:hypothetical protein
MEEGEGDLVTKGEEETRPFFLTAAKEEEERRGSASRRSSRDERFERKVGPKGAPAAPLRALAFEMEVAVALLRKAELPLMEVEWWCRTGRKGTEGEVERERGSFDSSCCWLNSPESFLGIKFSLTGPSSSPLTLREPEDLRWTGEFLLLVLAVGILDAE